MRKNSTKEIITSAWISCQRYIFCPYLWGDNEVKEKRCFGLESIGERTKPTERPLPLQRRREKPTTKARRLLPRARYDLGLKTPSACL